jgi:hypothetical protein
VSSLDLEGIVGNPEVIAGPMCELPINENVFFCGGAPHTSIGDNLLVKQARGTLSDSALSF